MSVQRSGERGRGDDVTRRRALALGAWSGAVAVAGSIATSHRGRTGATARATGGAATDAALRAGAGDAAAGADGAGGAASASDAHAAGSPSASPAVDGAAPSDAATGPPVGSAPLTGEALVHHVARRLTFGPTPEVLGDVSALGVDGWVEWQLAPSAVEDEALERRLDLLEDLRRSPAELERRGTTGEAALVDLRLAKLLRAVSSRRQLLELAVELWHDVFAASAAKAPVEIYLPAFDRDVIRPNALGNYADLLIAVTRSGAMLEYLDTARSTADEPNENHARELLELHTVGRGSGYTQSDVVGVARALSGWTLDAERRPVFDPARHDARPASVLGWSTPGRTGADAAGELDALLRHLAAHPATARRVAHLLALRFAADAPPPHLVDDLAATYLSTNGSIAGVLRRLVATDDFRRGVPVARRPFDLVAAALRATAATIEVGGPLEGLGGRGREASWSFYGIECRMGHRSFAAANPSGHRLPGGAWMTGDALVNRWTFAHLLAHDGFAGISIDPSSLVQTPATAGAAVDHLARRFVGAPVSAATRSGALVALDRADGDPVGSGAELVPAISFLLASPELQVR